MVLSANVSYFFCLIGINKVLIRVYTMVYLPASCRVLISKAVLFFFWYISQ